MNLVTVHPMYCQKARVLWIIIVDHRIPVLAITLTLYFTFNAISTGNPFTSTQFITLIEMIH